MLSDKLKDSNMHALEQLNQQQQQYSSQPICCWLDFYVLLLSEYATAANE